MSHSHSNTKRDLIDSVTRYILFQWIKVRAGPPGRQAHLVYLRQTHIAAADGTMLAEHYSANTASSRLSSGSLTYLLSLALGVTAESAKRLSTEMQRLHSYLADSSFPLRLLPLRSHAFQRVGPRFQPAAQCSLKALFGFLFIGLVARVSHAQYKGRSVQKPKGPIKSRKAQDSSAQTPIRHLFETCKAH